MKLNELRWKYLNPWTMGSQQLWSPSGHIARVTKHVPDQERHAHAGLDLTTPYRIHRHEVDNSTSPALDALECAILIAEYVEFDRRTHGDAYPD